MLNRRWNENVSICINELYTYYVEDPVIELSLRNYKNEHVIVQHLPIRIKSAVVLY